VLGIVQSAPFQMKKAPAPVALAPDGAAPQVATVRKDSGLSSRLEE